MLLDFSLLKKRSNFAFHSIEHSILKAASRASLLPCSELCHTARRYSLHKAASHVFSGGSGATSSASVAVSSPAAPAALALALALTALAAPAALAALRSASASLAPIYRLLKLSISCSNSKLSKLTPILALSNSEGRFLSMLFKASEQAFLVSFLLLALELETKRKLSLG